MSQPAFDFGDGDADERPDEITWSVRELADAINGTLRRGFGDGVWVRGEIQGWNERGPHAYFRLVEDGPDGKAVLNVQFFANVRMRMRPLLERHRIRLADGLKVRIHGHLDFYGPSGQLGLKMAGLDARFTLGDLAVQRAEVVRRLVATGRYDANRGVPMPAVPLRVGVVTSVGSAAWHDFSHELETSGFGFVVRAVDVRVQGDQAVEMVARAVAGLGRRGDLDVIVVVRGGGARTELATFDAEAIALAITACPVPVLTGLGHEIDRSVADEVAHLALKTPTACAGALIDAVRRSVERMEESHAAICRLAVAGADRAADRLTVREARLGERVDRRLVQAVDALEARHGRITERARRALDRADSSVAAAVATLGRIPQRLDAETRHLDGLATQVRLVDPTRALERGWSISRAADGRTVRHVADLAPGDMIVTTVVDGRITSRVEEIAPTVPMGADPAAPSTPVDPSDSADPTPYTEEPRA